MKLSISEFFARLDASSFQISGDEDRCSLQDTLAGHSLNVWRQEFTTMNDRQKRHFQFVVMHALSTEEFNRYYLEVIAPEVVEEAVQIRTQVFEKDNQRLRDELSTNKIAFAEMSDMLDENRNRAQKLYAEAEELRREKVKLEAEIGPLRRIVNAFQTFQRELSEI